MAAWELCDDADSVESDDVIEINAEDEELEKEIGDW